MQNKYTVITKAIKNKKEIKEKKETDAPKYPRSIVATPRSTPRSYDNNDRIFSNFPLSMHDACPDPERPKANLCPIGKWTL